MPSLHRFQRDNRKSKAAYWQALTKRKAQEWYSPQNNSVVIGVASEAILPDVPDGICGVMITSDHTLYFAALLAGHVVRPGYDLPAFPSPIDALGTELYTSITVPN